MITEPKIDQTTPEPTAPSGKWMQQALIAGAVYFVFNFVLPKIHVDYARIPSWAALVLVATSTIAFMLLQLWVPRTIVAMEWPAKKNVIGALVFGAVWAIITFVHPIPFVGRCLRGLTLTVSLAFFGILLSRIVREAKMLLPIALVAMIIDVVGAMTPIGFTNNAIQQNQPVIQPFLVPMPTVGVLHTLSYVGPGDALFIAFFFGIVQRNRLNMAGTFWLMFGLLAASMLAVLADIGNIAALLPMGIAVIAANIRYFKFDRSEVFAMIYAGVLAIAVTIAFFVYTHTHVFKKRLPVSPSPGSTLTPNNTSGPKTN
ncbi:MAG: hypothetical protein ABIY70_01595 [Capsulimonas sp.]|uniref:hypothetical protein n=1 Tax=Capsulimonas sp. TaxID=2494211 RepID=UPI003263EBBF